MIVATALAAVASFLGGMWLFGVTAAAAAAIATANHAVAAMRDPAVDERAREAAVQRASLQLLSRFGSILVRGVMTLALSLAPVWAADAAGIAPASAVFAFLARWDVVLATTVVMTVGYLAWRRVWLSN